MDEVQIEEAAGNSQREPAPKANEKTMEPSGAVKVNKKVKPEAVKETSLKRKPAQRVNKQAVLYAGMALGMTVLLAMTFAPEPKKKDAVEVANDVGEKPNFQKGLAQAAYARETGQPKETMDEATYVPPAAPVQPPQMKPVTVSAPAKESAAPTPAVTRTPARVEPVATMPVAAPVYGEVEMTERAARTSSMTAGGGAGGIASTTLGTYVAAETTPRTVSTMPTTGGTSTPTAGQIYADWNDQAGKAAFAGSSSGTVVAKAPSAPENTVFAGTVIPAVLLTGINTDLPGDVLAVVTENIYDTITGKKILIPQGTRLMAQYNSGVTWGQGRVQVVWERMIRPDGVSIDLGAMNGVDARGYAGYKGRVDEHFLRMAGGLGLMTLTSLISGQLEYSAKTITPAGAEIINDVGSQVQRTGAGFVDRTMDIQPTITLKPGTKVMVFVNSDMIMPMSTAAAEPSKYTLGGRP